MQYKKKYTIAQAVRKLEHGHMLRVQYCGYADETGTCFIYRFAGDVEDRFAWMA